MLGSVRCNLPQCPCFMELRVRLDMSYLGENLNFTKTHGYSAWNNDRLSGYVFCFLPGIVSSAKIVIVQWSRRKRAIYSDHSVPLTLLWRNPSRTPWQEQSRCLPQSCGIGVSPTWMTPTLYEVTWRKWRPYIVSQNCPPKNTTIYIFFESMDLLFLSKV